jgi:parallel beta-helix repeat protein
MNKSELTPSRRGLLSILFLVSLASAIAASISSAELGAGRSITSTAEVGTWDPSALGVSWAEDFRSIAANEINVKTDSRLSIKAVGDGIADDAPAVGAAIQLASLSGGGTVYLPVGDYKIVTPSDPKRGNPLIVPSRIILRGNSAMASRIFVYDSSANLETDNIETWGGIDFRGSSLVGMTDLGIYAVNSSASPCAVIWNRDRIKVSKLFFNNLEIHLANCRPFWFQSIDSLLVQKSLFESAATRNGPVYIVNNANIIFRNNQVLYHFGRVQMQNNSHLLMQANRIIRDAQNKDMDGKTAIESGGVELSLGQDVKVLDNTIQTLNAPTDEHGDGEAITTQNSNIQDVLDAGSATKLTSNTLSDSNALWGDVTVSRLRRYPEVVAIFSGNATGEWRHIKDVDPQTKTLSVDEAWNPVPAMGSLYSIFVWTLSDAIIQGNTLMDNPNGIVLWDGCRNCVVQDNTLINSRGIILRTVDQSLDLLLYPQGRREHQLALNNKISNNVVSNSSGLRPAFIALDAEAFAPDGYRGMGMMSVQVEGNTIEPYAANPSQSYDPRHNQIPQEGFFPCILFGPAPAKDPVTTVFRNIHFWNNTQSQAVTYAPGLLPYTTKACVSSSAPAHN